MHAHTLMCVERFCLEWRCHGCVQEAVYSAREDAGHKGWFELDSPATPERLRMACADHLTAPFAAPTFRPKISC